MSDKTKKLVKPVVVLPPVGTSIKNSGRRIRGMS